MAREGTAVRASAAGKVMFAGVEPRQFGNLVVVDHGDGWQSAYAFLSRITVKEGEKVAAGRTGGPVRPDRPRAAGQNSISNCGGATGRSIRQASSRLRN